MTVLKKNPEKKIIILTCYDYPSARALDNSDVDVVFVGDSVGTNTLGYVSEVQVTMDDMIHHLKAVRRGVTTKTLMVDLPYNTFTTPELGLANARLLAGKGADIVKIEGGKSIVPVIKAIVGSGIAVMGHIGFQPQVAQSARRTVVGALAEEATALLEDALALQEAGACSIVLECVPEAVAKEITEHLRIPTIGIGSGKYTDGQVLVFVDIVGWYNLPFRFIKRYDNFYERTIDAANHFVEDVKTGVYPQRNHAFGIKADQLDAFRTSITAK